MSFYECVYIARQDISNQQVDTLVEQFGEILKQHGGEIAKKEYWGLRNLSYRIKKNRKGHYVMMNIDAPPAAVAEMERLEKINEDIIRAMTIRVEELDVEPSPVLRSRDERDERRGREGGRF